jgi:carbon-monoxide dehydrogenase large subunit
MDRIRFVQSDTAVVPRGGGTGGSRSLQLAGSAVMQAAERVLEQARSLTASELEAAAQDIVVHDDGRLGVAGVPARGLSWSEVAALAADRDGQAGDGASGADGGSGSGAGGADGAGGGSGGAGGNGRGAADGAGALAAELDFNQEGATFPFGAHVSVVEVDIETGRVRMRRHVAVDDCGRILNPLLVRGQQHGGIAQGAAQALFEWVQYDDEGNPVTTNLMDYAIPAASEFPSFEVSNTQTDSPRNPLGAKGIGESGTIGSTPAIQNAVVDALSHLGVRHIDMPCTPERVWRAIQEVRA